MNPGNGKLLESKGTTRAISCAGEFPVFRRVSVIRSNLPGSKLILLLEESNFA